MATRDEIYNLIYKDIKSKLKVMKRDAKKVLQSAVGRGARIAAREVEEIHAQYVAIYYKNYEPTVYRRNSPRWNLSKTILSKQVNQKTGDVVVNFGSANLRFLDTPRSDPNMVFDSFMSGSRYSNAAVMKADPKHFGTNVVKFAPKGQREVMKGTWGTVQPYDSFLDTLDGFYQRHFRNYIVRYINSNWSIDTYFQTL